MEQFEKIIIRMYRSSFVQSIIFSVTGFRQQQARPWSSLLGGLLVSLLVAQPTIAAERISVWLGLLQFSIPVRSLESFAKTGEPDSDLRPFLNRLSAQQQSQLRSALSYRVPLTPVALSQVFYTNLGQSSLQSLGTVIQTADRQNGAQALRAALILAAANGQKLTALNVLRQFPSESVRVDGVRALRLAQNFQEQTRDRDRTVAAIQQQATQQAAQSRFDFSQKPDLRQPGGTPWTRQSLVVQDESRDRSIPVDLYLPQVRVAAVPVIVLLHGLAGDRGNFTYLAKHLASYGFAVIVPESPGNSSQQFQKFLRWQGPEPTAQELIQQPQDVTAVLNELERLATTQPEIAPLNLKQVGVIGHSQGGFATLSLAGAPIDWTQLKQRCQQDTQFEFARQAQCQLLRVKSNLPNLQDSRVVAVLPISPVTSTLLSSTSMEQIQIPIMMLSASADTVTPAVPEQIHPFSDLTVRDRFLVLMDPATHLSPLDEQALGWIGATIPAALFGPDPAIARSFVQAISTAFFQVYLNTPAADPTYLTAAYAQSLSSPTLRFSLIK